MVGCYRYEIVGCYVLHRYMYLYGSHATCVAMHMVQLETSGVTINHNFSNVVLEETNALTKRQKRIAVRLLWSIHD